VIDRFRTWTSRRLGREGGPAASSRALPPGVDEVRLLESPDALRLAELAGVLAVLDQAIAAMRTLAADRRPGGDASDPIVDLALLRFAMIQFVGAFKARRGSVRLTPKQAFDPAGVKFFDHVSAFADQLGGAHARVVGQTETVVLLKRSGDRAGVLGLTTRARRPDRLTALELANLAEFMERGRAAYVEAFDRMRAKVLDELEAMEADALLALRLLETSE